MSEAESLNLSAEDLMPSWATGLEHATPNPASKADKRERRDEQRNGKAQGNRDGRQFDSGGRGGGGGFKSDGRHQQGGRGRDDRNRGSHDRRGQDRQPVRAEDIVPQVDFIAEPTQNAVKALCKHIRSTNRAYAMSEVAKMVLAEPDRYWVIFRNKSNQSDATDKKPSAQNKAGKPFRMVRCKSDGSLWLSREEAVSHFLHTPELLNEFYQVEEVKIEAPKGNFSVVAVCGLSGTILGPPNHHQYQQNISALHRERFGNMPLERFKSRIEMRRDVETIEQWKEQMSTSKHYQLRSEKPDSANKEQSPADEVKPALDETISKSVEGTPNQADEESQQSIPAAPDGNPTEKTNGPPAVDITDETAQAQGPSDEAKQKTDDQTEASEAAESMLAETTSTESKSAESAEPVITSMAELTRHFRENFARRIFKEVGEARLPGNVSKNELSSALNERMNAEINWQKRGFPLPMIRSLCRKFEQQGLKFFKRGEKALFVTAAQPRALAQDTVLSNRLAMMLTLVQDQPGTLAGKLIEHFCSKTEKPTESASAKTDGQSEDRKKNVAAAIANPSKDELALLADLRWLLTEGYLIEFPNSELFAGSVATVNKRKRRPAKRSKKKKPALKKQQADATNERKKTVETPAANETLITKPAEESKDTPASEA